MKIAIPVISDEGLNGQVSEHFGRCEAFVLLDEDGKIVGRVKNVSRHMGGTLLPPEILKKQDVNVLLCRGLGTKALQNFEKSGVQVFIGEADAVLEIFEKWKNGELEQATENNSCAGHE